jgi:hypothetical protein
MTDILDPTGLDALSLDELASYKEKIEKAFAERREQQKNALLDQIKSLYTLGGITPQGNLEKPVDKFYKWLILHSSQ